MSKEEINIEELTSGDAREDYKLKVVIVGDSGVGKSNIIFRFSYDKYIPNQLATKGIEYTKKNAVVIHFYVVPVAVYVIAVFAVIVGVVKMTN